MNDFRDPFPKGFEGSCLELHRPVSISRRHLMAMALSGAFVSTSRLASAADRQTLHFGILPIGGAVDSRNSWGPVLDDLSRVLGRPFSVLSATSYEILGEAVRRGEIDMAFLSGKLALEAVTQHDMRVIAQVTRHDGLPGYRAVLVSRAGGEVTDLNAVLAEPGRWRLARGEKSSMSGYIIPKMQLFLPRRIDIETSFRGEIVSTHQRTALAVVNGEADLATNNTADLELFRNQFPAEASRLRILWESDLIPHGVIVWRRQASGDMHLLVQRFLAQFGRGEGAVAEAQRGALKRLHDLAGFLAADNRALLPVAQLTHQLDLESARSAQWINEAARQARLARIESQFAAQLKRLNAE